MKKMSVLFAVLVVALFMSVGTAVYAEENNTLGTKSYHVELFNEGKIPKIKKVDESLREKYDFILSRLCSFSQEIELNGLDVESVLELYEQVINNNPKLFFVKGTLNLSQKEGCITVYPEYSPRYTDDSMQLFSNSEYNLELQRILSHVKDSMSDIEKALVVHDYITSHYEYDYENYVNDTIPEESYTMYGLLTKKTGVCQAYASTYAYIMNDLLGIDCIMVGSWEMDHAWNMIKIDNKWYHVDTTWDDPVPDSFGSSGHNYFLLSDQGIARDHYGWYSEYTASDTTYDDYFWYFAVNSPFVYVNGDWYYVRTNSIYKYNFQTGISEFVYNVLSASGMVYFNGCLVYSYMNGIYCISLDGSSFGLIKAFDQNLKGIRLRDGFLEYKLEDTIYILELTKENTADRLFSFTYSDGKLTIKGKGEMPYGSLYMRPWEFSSPDITDVIIEPGATSICKRAFSGFTSLKSISIPDTVTKIDDYAFYKCSSLENIDLPDTVKEIGKYAFYSCRKLTQINMPEILTVIDDYAFYGCQSIRNLSYANDLTFIGKYAFYYCDSMQSIILPKSIQYISECAFSYCGYYANIFYEGNEDDWSEITIEKDGVNSTYYIIYSYQNYHVWWEYNDRTNVLIIKGNGPMAFVNQSFIPWRNDIIYDVKEIIIDDGITTISGFAFENCFHLTSITIPKSVQVIERYAFAACFNLKEVYFEGNAPVLKEDVFDSPGLKIYFRKGAAGFDTPTWHGYPCYVNTSFIEIENIHYEDSRFILDFTYGEDIYKLNGKAFAAIYSDDGKKLIGMAWVNLDRSLESSVSIPLSGQKSGTYLIKAFVWENFYSLKPIVREYSKKIVLAPNDRLF